MKTLFLIRHAKSSQEFGVDDFDRPLNDRGKRDAPAMGKRIRDREIRIETFVSSPAKRASQTAGLFAGKYGFAEEAIRYVPALYLAAPAALRKVIEEIDDQYSSAAIFAHNPGLTDLANELTNIRIDNMPTCSIYAVSVQTERWADFMAAEKQYLFFDYPKKIAD
ncbi:MAG: histidine phosphatase family protein [Williamsia sp.]|nr:histidine phosphatase family protein [Williamsia sp.]